jgi:hypothetical protein
MWIQMELASFANHRRGKIKLCLSNVLSFVSGALIRNTELKLNSNLWASQIFRPFDLIALRTLGGKLCEFWSSNWQNNLGSSLMLFVSCPRHFHVRSEKHHFTLIQNHRKAQLYIFWSFYFMQNMTKHNNIKSTIFQEFNTPNNIFLCSYLHQMPGNYRSFKAFVLL